MRLTTKNNLKRRGIKSIAGQHRNLLDFINHNYDKKSYLLPMLFKTWKAGYPDVPSQQRFITKYPRVCLMLITTKF